MGQTKQAHVTEDEISMILDGTEDQHLRDHVGVCSECQRRVEDARRIEMSLKQRLLCHDCPPSHKLTDYSFGLVSEEERDRIAGHLKICKSCRDELATLTKFLEEEDQLPSAGSSEGKIIRLPTDYFVARFDPNQRKRQVRGREKRQLRAQTNGIVVLLDFQVVASGTAIEGTVIDTDDSRDWIGSLIEFRKQDVLHTTCQIDELGTFRCQLAEDGTYTLRITSPTGGIVVVPDIVIDPQRGT